MCFLGDRRNKVPYQAAIPDRTQPGTLCCGGLLPLSVRHLLIEEVAELQQRFSNRALSQSQRRSSQ